MAVTVNAAVYGVAVYGTAVYGKIIVSNLDQVEATGQINGVTANVASVVTGVSATGAVGTPEPIPSEPLDSVFATGQIGTLKVNLVEKVDSVDATTTLGQIGFSNTVIIGEGVEATGVVEEVVAGGFEIDITERVTDGVEGSGQVSAVRANPTEKLTGVDATGSVDDGFTFSNTTLLQSVVGTVQEPSVEPQITEIIGGVFATGAVNDSFTFSNTTLLSSVGATGAVGQTTETGVLFDFQAVREQYDRRRTIRIGRAA